MLVVYRPGKPLSRFTGDGRAIFGWKFARASSQVELYQDYQHGDPVKRFDLRDVETGRLIGKWDAEITAISPAWTRGLQ
jgi:hypothetical protein